MHIPVKDLHWLVWGNQQPPATVSKVNLIHLYIFSWFVIFRVKLGARQNRGAVLGVSFWSPLLAEEQIEPCGRNRLHGLGSTGATKAAGGAHQHLSSTDVEKLQIFWCGSDIKAALMLCPRVRYQWGLAPEFLSVRTLRGDFHHQMHWFFHPKALKTTRRFSSDCQRERNCHSA